MALNSKGRHLHLLNMTQTLPTIIVQLDEEELLFYDVL